MLRRPCVLQIALTRVCSRLELPGGLRFNKLPICEIPSKASVQVVDHHILSWKKMSPMPMDIYYRVLMQNTTKMNKITAYPLPNQLL